MWQAFVTSCAGRLAACQMMDHPAVYHPKRRCATPHRLLHRINIFEQPFNIEDRKVRCNGQLAPFNHFLLRLLAAAFAAPVRLSTHRSISA